MPLFRRKKDEPIDDVFYVHLREDGGIFVVRGDTGEQMWTTLAGLRMELERLRDIGGRLLYSRDNPERDPPGILEKVFQEIADYDFQIQLTDDPHPASQLEGGASSLMAAAYIGDDGVVADLIERGADLEAKDQDGLTALMYACNGGQPASTRALVERGADVNAVDNQKSTAIMFAAQHDHVDIVTFLIERGADVNARGEHGLTALGFCLQNDHEQSAALLRKAGALE
jgi:hypothetical protein